MTTSLPKPNPTHEKSAGYVETNTCEIKEIIENFDVASFFRHTLNLEEEAANVELDKEFSYTLYITESKRHECPKLKIMIGGEEILLSVMYNV